MKGKKDLYSWKEVILCSRKIVRGRGANSFLCRLNNGCFKSYEREVSTRLNNIHSRKDGFFRVFAAGLKDRLENGCSKF
jgi:hypothetical protein